MSIVSEKESKNKIPSASNRVVTLSKSASTSPASLSSRFSQLKSKPNHTPMATGIKKATLSQKGKSSNRGPKRNNKWKKKPAAPTAASLDAAIDTFMMKDPGIAKERLDADIDAYMSMEVETLGNPGAQLQPSSIE